MRLGKLSVENRRVESVFVVIEELVAAGTAEFRPGDVCDVLREQNAPLGTWQVRADFSTLESQGRIVCDPQSGAWQVSPEAMGKAQQAG